MKEALFYEQEKEQTVLCRLCNHHCHIKEGKRGLCGVRENKDGKLYSLVYGKLVSENIDPIEKKPLFHLLPGSKSYSISTVGCNFRCEHCQNYQISQYPHTRGRRHRWPEPLGRRGGGRRAKRRLPEHQLYLCGTDHFLRIRL